MKVLVALTLVVLGGCEFGATAPVASRHDALQLVVGGPDAGLGAVVSSCSTTVLSAGRTEVRAGADRLADAPSVTALSCTPGTPVYLVGSSAGLGTASVGGWQFSGSAVTSLARGPSGNLLIGRVGRRLDALTLSGTIFPAWDAGTAALAWSADGTLFAAAEGSKIDVFVWNEATGATWRNSISVGSVVVRPNAMVIGDFLPNGTLDVAVGTVGGQVFVFSVWGGAGLVLRGDGGSFGVSLAVEPAHLATLDALLIGEPEMDLVVRMVGDAGRGEWRGAPGDDYGRSLTTISGRRLIIGAPGADGGAGAVSSESLIAPLISGDPFECRASLPCSLAKPASCFSGTCVGGVACVNQTPGCPVGVPCIFDGEGYECVFPAVVTDAGVEDAGSSDAGSEDAGSEDAGSEDAGVGDAGSVEDAGVIDDAGVTIDAGGQPSVVHFSAQGCTSVGVLIPWLLALFARCRR